MPESDNREGRLDRSGDRMARLERGVGRLETGILVLAVVVVGTFLLNLVQRTPDEPDPEQFIHGCIKTDGTLKIVNDPAECSDRETPISWLGE